MLDTLSAARERLAAPVDPCACAVATIVATEGSVPRPVGTSMLVDAVGTVRGSLTGGCVEGAVLEACQEALATGASAVHRFGYSDDDAFAVGLTCGGVVDVLVQPFFPAGFASPRPGSSGLVAECEGAEIPAADPIAIVALLPARGEDCGGAPSEPGGRRQTGSAPAVGAAAIADDDPETLAAALAPVVPGSVLGKAVQQVGAMVRSGRTGLVRIAPPEDRGEPLELFVESRTRAAHLVVVGANAFGQALVDAARPLGLRITLVDPRPAFTDAAAFPGAEVVRGWPHLFLADAARTGDVDARSLVCVLAHDPKVDIPTLVCALDLGVAYVGAMGSRRSDHDRRAALREEGLGEDALARLHSPIGLDLGAVTPAEVAVSILAEMLAVRAGQEHIAPLSRGTGPLHARSG